ncbi:MAG TPA: DNA polymerase Y family protein [Stellaceae bacterium]|nr:DNA polymerase Y family protein [Stellaceae bacterium]
MRRILSLWLERWPTDLIHRRRRVERPLVTVATVGGRRLVLAVDRAASLEGLAPGMTLADVQARLPDVAAVEADPAGDAAALARLVDWCLGFSPWTAADGADGVWLDVTGLVPLFASEAALAEELVRRLAAQGFAARAAVADTPGAAWAVARFAAAADRAIIVPPGGVRAALARLPMAALRLTPEVVRDLWRVGLRRIDTLYKLPRAPLAPRFGMSVARRLDQALGLIEEPISPHRPVVPLLERLGVAEPVMSAEALRRGMAELTERLCRRLAAEGVGVRRLEFAACRVDSRVQRVAIGTSRPSRDPAHLLRLLAPKIEEIDPGLGIEMMVLRALEVAAQEAEPLALGAVSDGTATLVDRLANRLGAANVLHVAPADSHVPERTGWRSALRGPAMPCGDAGGAGRPIRLLARPDPVEAVAPIPDDPPVLFRWRRGVHQVRHAEGPERIAAEWWRPKGEGGDDETRDYYRVEDEAGRRFWLYRAGADQPARWFLHGFFA